MSARNYRVRFHASDLHSQVEPPFDNADEGAT